MSTTLDQSMEIPITDPSFPEMEVIIQHNGTELSYGLDALPGGMALRLTLKDGTQRFIPVQGKNRAEMFCPSCEGTVILVITSGGEQYYDVATGEIIDEMFMKKIGRGERFLGQITFYC
ncbi:MAG TPA: hypothetical protein VK255_02030 [Patescibacteria group bacterium]|nr:hypothetical protein [Patescibacteria group bacterium]